jgi:hypothetical protein
MHALSILSGAEGLVLEGAGVCSSYSELKQAFL